MDICALVLAGGKSIRMNGNNKAFLTYKDKDFLHTITDVLDEFNDIYISVDNKEKYKNVKYELIEDEYKEIGPIGGIYSAIKHVDNEYVFVTACDMPKISKDIIRVLLDNVNKDDKCVVFEDSKGRIYPLAAIYSKDSLKTIEKMINKKDYRLKNLVNNLNGKVISLDHVNINEDMLDNINNPEQYKSLIKKTN